jgi:hypothetical protein
MPSFISLKGRQYYAPSVIVDVKNELVAPPPLGKSLAVFGDFPQLEKGKVYTFTQGGSATLEDLYPKVAKLRNIEKFWKQSLSVDGQANALSFINVQPVTQAEDDRLGDDDANGVDLSATTTATFKSRFWGRGGNNVSYNLSTPSTTPSGDSINLAANDEDLGYYRLTMFAPAVSSEPIVREAGYPNILSITYTDDNAADQNATITIADGNFTIVTDDGLNETIILDELQNLDDLKTTIENIDQRFAVTIQNYSVFPRQLDEGVFEFDDDVAVNTPVTVAFHAHARALEEMIANETSLPVEISYADDRYRLLEGDTDDTIRSRLSGGTESASTSTDYSGIFADSAIISKDFTTCVIESTTPAVHLQFKNYLNESELSQKERNGWVPAAENLSIDSINGTYVLPLNDKRLSVVGQSLTYIDFKGNRAEGTCFETALLLACMQGSVKAGQALSLTAPNQNSLVVETQENWNRDADAAKHKLVRKGIVGLSLNNNNSLVVVRSITSYLKDNELFNCEVSVRESIDASVRDLRSFLTSELGRSITSATKDRLKLLTQQRLSIHREQAIILGFKNVEVVVSGDTAFINYDVALTDPQNFIKATANIVSEL